MFHRLLLHQQYHHHHHHHHPFIITNLLKRSVVGHFHHRFLVVCTTTITPKKKNHHQPILIHNHHRHTYSPIIINKNSTTTSSFSSSSYEYPNRTDVPIITRTKASDVLLLNQSSSSSMNTTYGSDTDTTTTIAHPTIPPTTTTTTTTTTTKNMEVDPFDDGNTLSSQEISQIRIQQRLHLNTKLSSSVSHLLDTLLPSSSDSSSSVSSLSFIPFSSKNNNNNSNTTTTTTTTTTLVRKREEEEEEEKGKILPTIQTQVTTLPNGIRVASQEIISSSYGQVVSTLGILANACGSRYEEDEDDVEEEEYTYQKKNKKKKNMGVNHLMQLLAFSGIQYPSSSSSSFKQKNMDAGQFLSTMDSLGAITFASSSLESFLYCVDVLRPHSYQAFQLLADSILYPKMDEQSIEEGKRMIEYQWMDSLPTLSEVRMEEGIRLAAFGNNSNNNNKENDEKEKKKKMMMTMKNKRLQQLARPHFCPLDALPNLTIDSIQQFRTKHLLNPKHLVVAGVGIEHDVLVSWANQFFGHLESSSSSLQDMDKRVSIHEKQRMNFISSSSPASSMMIPSHYTGGCTHLSLVPSLTSDFHDHHHVYPHPHHHDHFDSHDHHPSVATPLSPQQVLSSSLMQDPFTRVALAFPTGGWYHTTDLIPACVLQTLLGGGNSFSAGGPGKGMYSRLYREILNRYYWAESAEAFTFFYQECGLIGMSGSCSTPDKAKDLTRVLAEHFLKLLTTPVSDEELSRARNMLKCNVLTQLESRLVVFEDIARQIGTYGKRETSTDMCMKIDSVSKEDIQRVVKTAMEGNRPTMCAMGESIEQIVPTMEEVETWFR